MSLQCQMTLNVHTSSSGQSPLPQATLSVYNPNASSVAVTGVNVAYYTPDGQPLVTMPVGITTVALGPGQTTVVPAASLITFGPFPIAIALPSMGGLFLGQPAGNATTPPATPAPRQLGMPVAVQVFIGAQVYASDGSVNEAGRDGLIVSWAARDPSGTGGGVGAFNDVDNSSLVAAVL